jgi:hypothetical protein
MLRRLRILALFAVLCAACPGITVVEAAERATSSDKWQITSIRACKDRRGYTSPNIEAIGSYPVYSFFVPRPVWTVNGVVVEAQPVYDRGRLTAYTLLGAAPALSTHTRNTIKLSLPDQNTSKVFRYDDARIPPGECYEFF